MRAGDWGVELTCSGLATLESTVVCALAGYVMADEKGKWGAYGQALGDTIEDTWKLVSMMAGSVRGPLYSPDIQGTGKGLIVSTATRMSLILPQCRVPTL